MKTLVLSLLLTIPSRILLVASNDAFDLGELATAHAIFESNGFAVDIATPSGGAAKPKAYDDDAPPFAAKEKLVNTLTVADVDSSQYAAMFLVGGSGAMHEFPSHAALQKQIATMADRGAVIGAVCHGPAALRDVKLANGRHLVDGKRVSAFTEEEEARFGGETAKAYPFVLEQALRARGAIFEEAPLMLVQVSRDGMLVTGQNPFSTARAAEEVLRALGITPRPRTPARDEATMLLIAEMLADPNARQKLDAAPDRYDAKLLATYGSLLLDSDVRGAVTLLEAASRHVKHPKVESALARAHQLLRKNNDDPSEAARPADRRPE
jgi:putative intracellular protease/amidase